MGPTTVNAAAQSADFEFAALAEARRYRAALARAFAPFLRGRVLEVGAGTGQFSADLRPLSGIAEYLAVEPDARFHAGFRAAHPSVPLHSGFAAEVPVGPGWDALVSVNVLEHIEDDAAELRVWHRLLAPREGCLCLFVPARPEIYAPIDRDFGHFRRYRRAEVRDRLLAAGFALERLQYFNLVGYFLWWLNFVVRRARHFDPAMVRAFDRWVFPVTHGIESRLGSPPIGQSVLAIARARAASR